MLLEQLLERPVAPWILRILAYVGTPLSVAELNERLSKKFIKQERPPASKEEISNDLSFLIATELIILNSDGNLHLTPSGQDFAKRLMPQVTTPTS